MTGLGFAGALLLAVVLWPSQAGAQAADACAACHLETGDERLAAPVKSFAADQGASFNGENGSGLTRRNKASPVSVVRLLDSMIEVDETTTPASQLDQRSQRDAWIDSLAVAGRSGTLARRMRGTAARNRCHAKTGTLNGVSALSGYCFQGPEDADHAVVFSLLMNRADVNRAHVVQDRMAALMARYRR